MSKKIGQSEKRKMAARSPRGFHHWVRHDGVVEGSPPATEMLYLLRMRGVLPMRLAVGLEAETPMTRLVEHIATLAPGRPVHVVVPEDLTEAEARRIARAVARLAVDKTGWTVLACELSGEEPLEREDG